MRSKWIGSWDGSHKLGPSSDMVLNMYKGLTKVLCASQGWVPKCNKLGMIKKLCF